MTQIWNTLAASLALVLATLAGVKSQSLHGGSPMLASASEGSSEFPLTTLPNGAPALVDASGNGVELKAFKRIASASTVTDSLLLEFAEPQHIVAFTAYSMTQGWEKHRYGGAKSIDQLNDTEAVLALNPDLVLANLHGSEQVVQRLREAGIAVFNLGQMRGVDGFLATVHAVATLCQRPQLGEQYARSFKQRLERIAATLPSDQRKSAAYVAQFGGKLYGSGRNTNYADILKYAGLKDLGAEHYQGFPEYSAEDLLTLDPDLLVTRSGDTAALCRQPGLAQLGACTDPAHRIVELPEAVISSAGAEMLIAAEWLNDRAYHSGASTSP